MNTPTRTRGSAAGERRPARPRGDAAGRCPGISGSARRGGPTPSAEEGLGIALATLAARMPVPLTLHGSLSCCCPNGVQAGRALDLFSDNVGGLGYLLKDRVTDVEDFLDAVQRVARGGSAVDPEVVAALLVASRRHDPLPALTDRERDVLAKMAEGRSNAAIAEALRVTRKTVETHANDLFSKLGLEPGSDDNRRVLAVLAWLRAQR